MSKKIAISARPKAKQNPDLWVEKRDSDDDRSSVKAKRLTIDIDPDLHMQLKVSCAQRGIQIADLIRTLIQNEVQKHGPS
jgi:predicted HicB family RNase H-like nuclease